MPFERSNRHSNGIFLACKRKKNVIPLHRLSAEDAKKLLFNY